jgi:serine/threonine protein phosphatase PrpC
MYAVYDGHGGVAAVDFIKDRLPDLIRRHVLYDDSKQMATVLRETFENTEVELLEHLRGHHRPLQERTSPASREAARPGSAKLAACSPGEEASLPSGGESVGKLSPGCVACVTVVRENTIHVANLGDCRAILCCHGDAVELTKDHRPDVNEGERERLQQLGITVSSDGYIHGRISMSRAFGDWVWDAEEKCRGLLCTPETTEAEVTDDVEFLLVACDGIFEKMSSKEAMRTVRRKLRTTGGDAKAAAESLVKFAQALNGSDNLSAVVVVFKVPPPIDTAPRRYA